VSAQHFWNSFSPVRELGCRSLFRRPILTCILFFVK
jgi:hypothetical protein